MRLALLGSDSESVLLVRTAVEQGHQLIWVGDIAVPLGDSLTDVAASDRADQWEELFAPGICEAVILGRGHAPSAQRTDQLIQLVKYGIATLTTFPVVDSLLSYYEVDLVQTESGAVLHHFNPVLPPPELLAQWIGWMQAGHPELGAIEQVLWDRPLEDRGRENVVWHFSRDLEVLDGIAGPLDRLGAVGSTNETTTYSGLNVQLLGKRNVPVRWSVGPAAQSTRATLTFVGHEGTLPFELGDQNSADSATKEAAQRCLASFVSALSSSSERSPTWPAALRAMELTDTIEISLRRGRMIEVHRQQLTEELSFRGRMSAVGCGVLLLLPPLLIVAGWVAEQLGLPVANYWAHGLLALLAVFLLLQLVPKLFLKPRASDSPAAQQNVVSEDDES